MRNGNDCLRKIAGFDCIQEPERLIFRPNAKRSRDAENSLLAGCILLGVFAPVALAFLWVMRPSMDGLSPVFWICGIALGICIPAGIAVFFSYRDHVRDRSTPVVLDKGADRLLYGDQEICRLSCIERVWLRRIDFDSPKLSDYSVAVALKDGRTIPRAVFDERRFSLGSQARHVEQVVRDLASFIGAEFSLTVRTTSTSGLKGGPMGVL